MNLFDETFPKHHQEYKVENKILAINGSPRKGGNSDFLLKSIKETSDEEGIEFNTIHLRDLQFSSCIACERCRKDKICTGCKDAISWLYPLLLSSKGLVLISPTHNYNVTALMKAFIDRLYCFYDFETPRPRAWSSRLAKQDRKAMILGVCEQKNAEDMGFTMDGMKLPLSALGYDVLSSIPVLGVFDRAVVREKQEVLKKIASEASLFCKSLLSD